MVLLGVLLPLVALLRLLACGTAMAGFVVAALLADGTRGVLLVVALLLELGATARGRCQKDPEELLLPLRRLE
jgi:hypothetical protein